MTQPKKKFTIIQIITIVLLVLYAVWEKNMQQWISEHHPVGGGGGAVIRVDLVVIIPVLVVMVLISVWQYFRGKR